MRYASVCSGIEAATVAWHPLGWQPVAFSEIEPFPRAVLAHHYPHVPNWGDMTRFREWPDATVDLLVGGTPCQSFSVAGLRKGLDDPRGNLALTYLATAERYRPEWLVWENVPGVLSSNGGRDFGAFLGALVELGYGFAYRVLDAQYVRVDGLERAVPQRRRRVFVVGCAGDWRRAAAVLFERESLSGNPAPRREAGQGVAPTVSTGTRGSGDFEPGGGLTADVCGALASSGGNAYPGQTLQDATVGQLIAFGGNNTAGPIEVAAGLNAKSTQRGDFETETFIAAPPVAKTLTRGAESAGKGGYAGRRQEDDDNLVAAPVAFDLAQITSSTNRSKAAADLPASTLSAQSDMHIASAWCVRRLTPTECERLQGFPDGYTAVPYRNKPAADGPRYKALGNSMAVNCMRWIGQRIALVSTIAREEAA